MGFLGRPFRPVVTLSFLLVTLLAWSVDAFAGQLTLTWVDSSPDELGFSIERSTGTTGAFGKLQTTGPGVTAYTDLTVADGITYCYRVRAFDATTFSDYSNAACAAAAAPVGLAVVRIGAGSGTVTSVPAGISCGTSCSGSYLSGTAMNLTASAAPGSTFTGWSGGGCRGTDSCTVTMTVTTTVVATFEPNPINVSLGLSLSRHAVPPGDTVQVSVTQANSGGATSLELYFIVLVPPALSATLGCPDGDAVVFLADGFSKILTPCINTAAPESLVPVYRDVAVPAAMPATTTPTFYAFNWPADIPGGVYTFAIFTAPVGTYANGTLSISTITAFASDSVQASP